MATYPIKMLKDEGNIPFVPLVGTDAIVDPQGRTLEERLSVKLGPDNLKPGSNVSITTQGYDCYINVNLPSGLTLIDNLTTTTAGQGSLDARQGSVLKGLIPTVVNNVTSTSTTSALSAYQGYLLSNKFNDYLLKTDLSVGISPADIRSTVTTPQTYQKSLRTYFMSNSTDGLNDGGSCHGILYYRPYGSNATDWSGGPAHEIGFTQNGNLHIRTGSNTSWGTWKQLAYITSNVASATKATQDGSGNTITSTYAKLSGGNTFTGAQTVNSGIIKSVHASSEAAVYAQYGTTNIHNIYLYANSGGAGIYSTDRGTVVGYSSGWTFNGNANSATTATKATQDGNGANIASTYMKIADAFKITATGTGNNGVYFKFSNGYMLSIQRYSAPVSAWGTWGNCSSAPLTMKNFPVAFSEIPYVNVTLECAGVNGWLATRGEDQKLTSTTRPQGYQIVRGTSASGTQEFYLNVVAYGKY